MVYLLRGYLAGHVLDQAFQHRPDQGLPARNASIESFAIHVRNVIAFLYNLKGRGSGDHHFADDYVTDIGAYRKARPRRPPALDREVVDRIHKQVAHLNYARAGYAPEERVWLYDDICLLRGKRDGSRPGERARELREDGQVGRLESPFPDTSTMSS